MANKLVPMISPERVLLSGEVRAVVLPATEGGMTAMPGPRAGTRISLSGAWNR
jgi:F-type H+-transporting ATPase subunit epsilon